MLLRCHSIWFVLVIFFEILNRKLSADRKLVGKLFSSIRVEIKSKFQRTQDYKVNLR